MSNGESLDGFVFPPFIPTASTRPAETPPAPPQEPAPAAEAAGRMTMPWDLETPIVRQADDAPAPPVAAADDGEDLPWLEVPARREAEAPAAPAQEDEAFPEWLAWDERDGAAAEAHARDTVAPIAGLEEFVAMDELGGFVAPPPAAEWAPAESDAFAQPAAEYDAAPVFGDAPAAEPVPELVFDDAPAAEPMPELVFDDAPAAEPVPDLVFDDAPAAGAAPAEEWSLAAPEAAEPPSVYDAPATTFEASPAAAEPSFEVSVDDGALSIQPAGAQPFAAGEDAALAAEEAVFAPEPSPFVADDEAVMASEPAPLVPDDEAVMASEPAPLVPDDEAGIAAEPDPFTAAAVAEAESVAPAAPADTPFDDVAARLEAIARMLRERPDELLAGGSSDPLALLVTGYVMGYTARGGR